MNRRLRLLRFTVLKRTFGGSMKAWLLNCFSPPCTMLASRHVEELHESAEYIRVKLRENDRPLFFSKNIPIRSLYQTLAEQLYDWQWHYYQIPQTKIEISDVVFDCGAAEGLFCLINHTKAKHIYAFEPLPDYIDGLVKTFVDITNVEVVNSALGASCGSAYLVKSGISSSITYDKTDTTIKIDTIDNFCENNNVKLSYIKADVEGHEIDVLKGGVRAIREYRPKIAITTYHGESVAREIKDFLASINPKYRILTKGIEANKGAPVMLHAWHEG